MHRPAPVDPGRVDVDHGRARTTPTTPSTPGGVLATPRRHRMDPRRTVTTHWTEQTSADHFDHLEEQQ